MGRQVCSREIDGQQLQTHPNAVEDKRHTWLGQQVPVDKGVGQVMGRTLLELSEVKELGRQMQDGSVGAVVVHQHCHLSQVNNNINIVHQHCHRSQVNNNINIVHQHCHLSQVNNNINNLLCSSQQEVKVVIQPHTLKYDREKMKSAYPEHATTEAG